MKKLLACVLALALLCAPAALAYVGARLKVVKCNEYITLREEPSTSAAALAHIPLGASVDEIHWSENGFWCVAYRGQTGYALSKYLSVVDDYAGKAVDLTAAQRYNVNLFLSNFTEQGFPQRSGCFDESYVDRGLLTLPWSTAGSTGRTGWSGATISAGTTCACRRDRSRLSSRSTLA